MTPGQRRRQVAKARAELYEALCVCATPLILFALGPDGERQEKSDYEECPVPGHERLVIDFAINIHSDGPCTCGTCFGCQHRTKKCPASCGLCAHEKFIADLQRQHDEGACLPACPLCKGVPPPDYAERGLALALSSLRNPRDTDPSPEPGPQLSPALPSTPARKVVVGMKPTPSPVFELSGSVTPGHAPIGFGRPAPRFQGNEPDCARCGHRFAQHSEQLEARPCMVAMTVGALNSGHCGCRAYVDPRAP